MNVDHYLVLQLDPSADPDVVEAAYKRLARKFHPDVSKEPDAERRMRALNEAFGILGSPPRRAIYDRQRELRIRAATMAAGIPREDPPTPTPNVSSQPPTASSPTEVPSTSSSERSRPDWKSPRSSPERSESQRRRASRPSQEGHRQSRKTDASTRAPGDASNGARRTVHTGVRIRRPRKIVFSRSRLSGWYNSANRAIEQLRFRVNCFGLVNARRIPVARFWGNRTLAIPAIDPWHAGLVATIVIAIVFTLSMGSFFANAFEPSELVAEAPASVLRPIVVNSAAQTPPTQVVLRRPVATPNVWPPSAYLESQNRDEFVARQSSASGMSGDYLTEATPVPRSLEPERTVTSAVQSEGKPVIGTQRGVLGALRMAAAAIERRVAGPRAPIPPVPPG